MPIDQLKRREFITLLGGAASAWATYTHAQQPAMRVIGVLGSTSADSLADILPGFSQGLKDAGYIEGQNVAIRTTAQPGARPSPRITC